MEDRDFIKPMAHFDVRLFNEQTNQIEIIPLSSASVGDVRKNPGHNDISESQLEMRRYIRRRVKNVVNAALVGNALANIAEYFELIYTFIDLGMTDSPFPNFVKSTTSFDFGDFSQIRRMIYGISNTPNLFRNGRITIDLFMYTNQYVKRKDRQATDEYLKDILDGTFVELFSKYNKVVQTVGRMYVIIAPDTPKYLKNPYALSSQAQQPDKIILPPEQQIPIETADAIPEQVTSEPEEKFPFELPNGEKLIKVNLNDGEHYIVLGKNMTYDWAMQIKAKIESMNSIVGKILTIDQLNTILRIMELLQSGFTKEQIADYMYRTKQMTISDIKQYR